MRLMAKIWVILLTLTFSSPAFAVDINLINIDVGSPEGQQLSQVYGDAYGFTPQQVAPAMYGPAEEVPSILKIAQAAGTVPMTVWMMRKMGMSYGNILSNFALAPAVLAGAPLGGYPSPYAGPVYPQWGRFTDPFLVNVGRTYFLTQVLKINPQFVPFIPVRGIDFSRAIIYPYHPVHGTWLPPGIAKKYGLWIPPGQRKKMGWFPWGGGYYDKHGWKHGWKDDDHGYRGLWKDNDDDDDDHHGGFKGKWDDDKFESKSKGKSSNGKDLASEHGGGSSKGKGKGGSTDFHGGGKGGGKGKNK